MTNNDEVVFDANSGISVEEQQEILSRINGIAEKNRQSLSQGSSGGKTKIAAKKSGAFFPALVNVAAVVILFTGGLLLVSFNGKKDAQVREGNKVYNLTERALIEEIRKDTASKLASKEMEIESISSRLEEVDSQLRQLYSGNQELTAEQRSAESRLLALQNAYRLELAALQNERSLILEESRSREASLRAQLEERTREFTAAQQQSSAELGSAREELERLTGEQQTAAAVDAQMAGGLAAVNDLVRTGQLDQASAAVKELRSFLNTGAFQTNRSLSARKEFYSQAVNSVEAVNEDARNNRSGPSVAANGGDGDLAELQTKIEQLEGAIDERDKTIAALSSGSSDQTRQLTEQVNALRREMETSAAEKDRTIAARDNTIKSLETEKEESAKTIAAQENTIKDLKSGTSTQQQDIDRLNNQILDIRQALQALSQ